MGIKLSTSSAVLLYLLLFGGALSSGPPKDTGPMPQPVGADTAARDLKKLQGTWQVVQLSHWGNFHKGHKGQTLVFKDGTLNWFGNSGTFVLDASERPKKLAFTFNTTVAKKRGVTEKVSLTRPCIYLFDDDELLISYIWSNDGDPAPKEFGTGIHYVYRLKRVDP